MQYLHSSVIKVRPPQISLERLPGFAAGHRRWTVAECEIDWTKRTKKNRPATASRSTAYVNVLRLAGFSCYRCVPQFL